MSSYPRATHFRKSLPVVDSLGQSFGSSITGRSTTLGNDSTQWNPLPHIVPSRMRLTLLRQLIILSQDCFSDCISRDVHQGWRVCKTKGKEISSQG